MSREYRALGRELRPGRRIRRRPLLTRLAGWVFRHLAEIVLLLLAIRVSQWSAAHVGPLWTATAAVALAAGALCWRRSRRWLTAAAGCMVTRARLRAAFGELRLSSHNGRLPLILAVVPSPVGERAWLICRSGSAPRTSPMSPTGCGRRASPARSASPGTAASPPWSRSM